MVEALLTLVAIVLIAAVIVPLALCYLLVRQVRRSRAVRLARRALTGRAAPAPQTRRGRAAPTAPTGLGRQWALLVADAHNARARFHQALSAAGSGPLHATLLEAAAEVDTAVAEAQRLAVQGDRTDRAQREVLRALDGQRRRRRSAQHAPADVIRSLDEATRAQHASAERLALATRATLCQLQLVVARLHELTAHTLELNALTATTGPSAAASVAERLAALRLASEEVELAARV